ncbi:MAG: hypothetical protein PQJ46_06805 [Spirochaetales bacterium]|nr:hypothetical protein [Spirochaetales bacterium]
MKRTICILLVLFVVTNYMLWSQELPVRTGELVKTFPIGSGDGALGYDYKEISDGNDVRPTGFCFDENGNLYICDNVNWRICIFDKDLNFIRAIEDSPIVEAVDMEVIDGDIIADFGISGIMKMDSDGNEIFTISTMGKAIESEISDDGFFIDGDMVFAYKDDGGLVGFKNPGVDNVKNFKNILDTDSVVEEILKNHPNLKIEKGAVEQKRSFSSSGVPQRTTSSDNGYHIYQNGEPLYRDYDRFKEIVGLDDGVLTRAVSESNEYSVYFEKYKKYSMKINVPNKEGNTFWEVRSRRYIVLNELGLPIAGFKLNQLYRAPGAAMSPEGDVYYLNSDDTGHHLYKIERDW